MIGKKIVRFKMFDEVGIKQSFENLGNSRSESNRAIVGGVRAVTLLRYRLNKCMLPRRRISTGNKDEAKKTTKNRRQFLSETNVYHHNTSVVLLKIMTTDDSIVLR